MYVAMALSISLIPNFELTICHNTIAIIAS